MSRSKYFVKLFPAGERCAIIHNHAIVKEQKMKKKYYLEAIRIVAVLFVIYNHSAAFLTFSELKNVEYAASFFLTLTCKAAVPLFYMISGVLLLGKKESLKELFEKRILRITAVIVIFSLLYHLKLVCSGAAEFAPLTILSELPFKEIYIPYWYLYSYLGMLLFLPLLRPLAQHMSKTVLFYLIGLMVASGALKLTGQYMNWQPLCEWFDISGMLRTTVFYPLAGYGLDKYIEEKQFFNKNNILRNAAYLIAAVISWRMVCGDQRNTGICSETYLWTWMPLITIVLFLNLKILFREERLSDKMKKILSLAGSCVFGVYLLDPYVGPFGKLDLIYRTLMPFTGYLIGYLIEIIFVLLIRLAMAWVLKKLPVLRKLL